MNYINRPQARLLSIGDARYKFGEWLRGRAFFFSKIAEQHVGFCRTKPSRQKASPPYLHTAGFSLLSLFLAIDFFGAAERIMHVKQ